MFDAFLTTLDLSDFWNTDFETSTDARLRFRITDEAARELSALPDLAILAHTR